jgi:hypothetical protein
MVRPIKQGLDYFPMDVTTDDKFELIEAKYGIIGFGVVIKLFQKIYKEGYFIEWTEDKMLIFKKTINVEINLIKEIVIDALHYGIFNKTLFDKYKILTSCGIQKRFLNACDRRKSIILNKNFIIVDINSINVNINWINEGKSTQSKVKYSKEYKYSEFYDYQIEVAKEYLTKHPEDRPICIEYYNFICWLFNKGKFSTKDILGKEIDNRKYNLLAMPKQLSYVEFVKIRYRLNEQGYMDMFEDMENWKDLKKRKEIYKTALTFIKNRQTVK